MDFPQVPVHEDTIENAVCFALNYAQLDHLIKIPLLLAAQEFEEASQSI